LKKTIALIGKGYWGTILQKYIPGYFDLKYVADSKFDKNIIWDDEKVESVIIATPIETHFEVGRDALEHNRNIFIEKPITTNVTEALALKTLANEKNLKIGVDYTWTFSHAIRKIKSVVDSIGELRYIEMHIKHLGRFMNFDAYWLLASHYLSVLALFYDLRDFNYTFSNNMFNKNMCTTGSIFFEHKKLSLNGRVDVSINYPGKDMQIVFYGTGGTIKFNPCIKDTVEITTYSKSYAKLPPDLIQEQSKHQFDEFNNLIYAMEYFNNLLDNKVESNLEAAIAITQILEEKAKREE